jgi:hypothetical protein
MDATITRLGQKWFHEIDDIDIDIDTAKGREGQ